MLNPSAFVNVSSVLVPVALPMVNELDLFDITHSTMMVRWKAAAGASDYMILYAPLTEGDSADEKEVRALTLPGAMTLP